MAHIHSVYDSDTHFSINPITRALRNESSGKVSLIQFDHNSERFTFEIPRMIEGHDMSLCNVVQVHYINIDTQTKERNIGVYDVSDLQISPEGDDVVILSWLISQNATRLVGSLNFLIRFACVTDSIVDYVWNTAVYAGISISTGIYNNAIVEEDYVDIIEQWKISVLAEFEAEAVRIANEMKADVSAWEKAESAVVREEMTAFGRQWNTTLDVERARINNALLLPEGSTTGDAELMDIRVGHDGVIYPTAGEAVREQGKKTQMVFDLHYRKVECVNLLPPTLTSGALADDGHTINASSISATSEFFPVKPGKKIVHTRISTGTTRVIDGPWIFAFYTEDKTLICIMKTTGALLPDTAVDVPANAAYARVVLHSSLSISHKPMVEYTEDGTTISPVYVEYFEPYYEYLQKLPYEGKNICVFGDSLAASGSGGNDTWIQRVAEDLKCNKVYNRGVGGSRVTGTDSSGNTVTQYAYIDADGDAYNRLVYATQRTVDGYTEISAIGSSADRINTIPTDTDIIIVLFGANDVGNTTGATFNADYKTMLDRIYARVPSADVYLCTMPFHKAFDLGEAASIYEGYRDRIRKIGVEYGFPVIDLKNEMMVNKNNYTNFMDSDYVHYNNRTGRDRTARVVTASIRRFV